MLKIYTDKMYNMLVVQYKLFFDKNIGPNEYSIYGT
jgi:hypothetical protein